VDREDVVTVIERPDWECGCLEDHRMTRDRAWCGACSEWCYEDLLCVRGEAIQLREKNEKLIAVLHETSAKLDEVLNIGRNGL
jgi:hypothetical protein